MAQTQAGIRVADPIEEARTDDARASDQGAVRIDRRPSRGHVSRRGGTRLALTGGFELTRDDRPAVLPHSAERVVALVALIGRPVSRGYIAGTLWLDRTDERALASLRSALWRIQKVAADVVVTVGDRLALRPGVEVDIHELTLWARQLRATRELDYANIDRLLSAQVVLPDWYDDWIIVERERFQQLRLHALEACCLLLTERGEHDRAIEVGIAAVASESLRESSRRALINAYLAEGNVNEAIQQYEAFRTLSRTELGVEPSPMLEELVARRMPGRRTRDAER